MLKNLGTIQQIVVRNNDLWSVQDSLDRAGHLPSGFKLREWIKQAQMGVSPGDLVKIHCFQCEKCLFDRFSELGTSWKMVIFYSRP